jgi:hypothetical protein
MKAAPRTVSRICRQPIIVGLVRERGPVLLQAARAAAPTTLVALAERYRARPRLRRRRSAGLCLRGFGARLVAPRWGELALDVTVPPRLGARRRASYQMKAAIPPIRATEPAAIRIASVLVNPLPEPDDVVVIGTTVGVVGAGVGIAGSDGLSGLG